MENVLNTLDLTAITDSSHLGLTAMPGPRDMGLAVLTNPSYLGWRPFIGSRIPFQTQVPWVWYLYQTLIPGSNQVKPYFYFYFNSNNIFLKFINNYINNNEKNNNNNF